jgi:protocatechuate 3,4-dioxygenase beta subunit
VTDHPQLHDHLEDHDLGLQHDLPRLDRTGMGRRGLLGVLGGVGLVGVAGGLTACSTGGTTSSASSTSASSSASAAGERPEPPSGGRGAGGAPESGVEVAEGEIPEETAGPYPGDGTNGPDVLSESGVVRSDMTTSFGSASGVAEGVGLTIKLKVYDLNGDTVNPMPGAAVYLWHCTREGGYSLYSEGVENENFLRAVQEADADGNIEFTSIFPGCYSGRWPHAHFEVYESLDKATSAANKLRTSQLALPQDVCETVYAEAGYEASVGNLAQLSLDSDNVFSDGYSLQLAKVTGSVAEGYVASLNVPV